MKSQDIKKTSTRQSHIGKRKLTNLESFKLKVLETLPEFEGQIRVRELIKSRWKVILMEKQKLFNLETFLIVWLSSSVIITQLHHVVFLNEAGLKLTFQPRESIFVNVGNVIALEL